MRAQQTFGLLNGQYGGALAMATRMQPRNYESSRISDQSRYEDGAAPTDDDMISKQ